MSFPNATPVTSTDAASLLTNAAAARGIAVPAGLSAIDEARWMVAALLSGLPSGYVFTNPADTITTITYSATMATDASLGRFFKITASDTSAMTISNPTNPTTGQTITYILANASGGTMGTITWGNAFKVAAITKPADGKNRTISFVYDGTNWLETNFSGVDVSN